MVGSSVQRGQTAVAAVVGQYFRVTFHGRCRGPIPATKESQIVCIGLHRLSLPFGALRLPASSPPARFRRIVCNCLVILGDRRLELANVQKTVARRQNSWLRLRLLFFSFSSSAFSFDKIRFVTVSCFDFAIMKLLRSLAVAPGFERWLRAETTTMA